MGKHTPKPWSYEKCKCGHAFCKSYRIEHSQPEGMFTLDDAALIAAAPELFEACKLAEAWLNDLRLEKCSGEHRAKLISRETDALYAMRKAIAKAEGK